MTVRWDILLLIQLEKQLSKDLFQANRMVNLHIL